MAGEIDLAPEKTLLTSAPPLTYQATSGSGTSEGSSGRAGPPPTARDCETIPPKRGPVSHPSFSSGQCSARTTLTGRTTFRGGPVKEKIKIRLEAYDHRILDKAALDIVDTAKRTGAQVAGPIPIPTKIERFTVQRSPHIDKKSREQFEIRTHARVVEIIEPTAKTNEVFSKVDVPAGVDIQIKQTVR